jgi:hypothetical protein
LALFDAALAVSIITILLLAMVIGVQAFDELAVHGGGEGEAILNIRSMIHGIASKPEDPEYWWVYALLLSSMIPSLVNLMIGGASLMRGVPGLPSLLLRFMPVGKAVPGFNREWIALVLALQFVGGVILGVLAQALVAVIIIGCLLPRFGLDLLQMAQGLVALDIPARAAQVFAGIL